MKVRSQPRPPSKALNAAREEAPGAREVKAGAPRRAPGETGARPIFEAEAKLKGPGRAGSAPRGARPGIDRRDVEPLPRAHLAAAAARPPTPENAIARLVSFLQHHDRAAAAAALGVIAVCPMPGVDLGNVVLAATRADPSAHPELDADLAVLDRRPAFVALSDEVRALARTQMMRHADDTFGRRSLSALVVTPGFAALDEAEKVFLLRWVGGANNVISVPARFALDREMSDDAFAKADAAGQRDRLRAFVARQPVREVVSRDGAAQVRAPYVLGAPAAVKDFEFRSGKADAARVEIQIDGQVIPIHTPAATDPAKGSFNTAEELAMGLAALPVRTRALVREVVIEPGRNPDDAYWSQLFHDPTLRSYMSAGNGRVSVYPTSFPASQAQVDGTIIHETGHLLAAAMFGGDLESEGWRSWKDAIARDPIVPSNYARSAPGEDFAESVQLYVQVRGTPDEGELRALMPLRFGILDRLFNPPPAAPVAPAPAPNG